MEREMEKPTHIGIIMDGNGRWGVSNFKNRIKGHRKGVDVLIETILTNNSPIGGAVDINIMVETGGKLRKLEDWEGILKQVGDLKIFDVLSLTEYLSVIDIRGY